MKSYYFDKIEEIFLLLNEGRFIELTNHLSDEAVLKLYDGQEVKGKVNVINIWKQFNKSFPDLNYEILKIFATQEYYEIKVLVSGTFISNLKLNNGQIIEPTFERFEMQQTIFMVLDDNGKIIREQKVFDYKEFYRQLKV